MKTNSTFPSRPPSCDGYPFLLVATAAAALWSLSTTAHGQIFVTQSGTNVISEYSTSGGPINIALVGGLNHPFGVAVSGTVLFVTNSGSGTIGKYTTSGATVNASLVTGLSSPSGVAVSGTSLFVANPGTGTIGKYTTSGATVNASLVPEAELNTPVNVVVLDGYLYVVNVNAGTIGKYTTSGATVNASLISGLSTPYGIAVSGTDLFVTNHSSGSAGTVAKYTTSGGTVNATLISGLTFPSALAVSGGNLYVTSRPSTTTGLIGKYTTAGATVNASIVTGLHEPYGIDVLPHPLQLVSAVSRKRHGGVVNFDVDLPITGEPGVECRTGGTDGTYIVVFTFNNNVVSGSASLTSGVGSVSGPPTFVSNRMSVQLTGIADVQKITLTLSNVTDDLGQVQPTTAVSANILLGDTTGNKVVNSTDVSQTKAQSGLAVSAANFREDVTISNSINASDVSVVKSRSGSGVP